MSPRLEKRSNPLLLVIYFIFLFCNCESDFPLVWVMNYFLCFLFCLQKGSGLFALLPPPKQAPVKQANRSLVPNVLTRKPNPSPPVRKPTPKAAAQSLKRKQPDSDPESDGESDGADFFSLNKEDKLPEIPASEINALTTSDVYQHADTSVANYVDPSASSYQQNAAYAEYKYQPYDNQATSSDAGALPQADSGQDFISFSGNEDLQLDEEAVCINNF